MRNRVSGFYLTFFLNIWGKRHGAKDTLKHSPTNRNRPRRLLVSRTQDFLTYVGSPTFGRQNLVLQIGSLLIKIPLKPGPPKPPKRRRTIELLRRSRSRHFNQLPCDIAYLIGSLFLFLSHLVGFLSFIGFWQCGI